MTTVSDMRNQILSAAARDAAGRFASLRWGIVTDDSPFTVDDLTAIALDSYTPRTDDKVAYVTQGADRLVLGAAAGDQIRDFGYGTVNITIGSGTDEVWWSRDGDWVDYHGWLSIGSGGGVTGNFTITLPVNAHTTAYQIGTAVAIATTPFNRQVGVSEINVSAFGQVLHFASDNTNAWGVATPLAWGSGAQLAWAIRYRAA